jgi:cytochrome c553
MFNGQVSSIAVAWAMVTSCVSCGGATATSSKASPEPDLSGYAGWPSWPRINEATFVSKGHGKAWVDVHVDPAFVDAYRAGAAPMPVGIRVVKAAHDDVEGSPGEVTGVTAMTKMEPGYDPENGDWFYGVYDPSGTVPKRQGKLAACIGCHDQWPERDHLGGVPGLWK